MRRARYLCAIAILGGIATTPLISPWSAFILTIALAKGMAALGIALLLRAGLMSLGHAVFYAAGAYTAAYLSRLLGVTDFFLLLAGALLSSILLSTLLGVLLSRYRSIFFAMLNLAASMIFFSLATRLYSLTGGSDGLPLHEPTFLGRALDHSSLTQAAFYAALLLALVCCGCVHRYLVSPIGKALDAIATNEIRLEYIGVSTRGVLLLSYVVSGALCGLGGAVSAIALGHVTPEMLFWTTSAQLLLGAAFGGYSSTLGPFAGALLLETARSFASAYAPSLWEMIMGLCAVSVAFFLPEGLVSLGDLLARRTRIARWA